MHTKSHIGYRPRPEGKARMDLVLSSFPKGLVLIRAPHQIPGQKVVKPQRDTCPLSTIFTTDTKVANKVLIAKKESIEEGAEHFRRDLLHNLFNHLVSVRKAYCLLIDSSIEEQIASSMSFPAAKLAQKKHKYDGLEP
ncbi:hypothetical protein YC2023_002316 [Brassica napus]